MTVFVTRALTSAEQACLYIANRLVEDPRLAYLLGPGSQSWDLLTAGVAAAVGCDLAEYRAELRGLIKPVRSVEAHRHDARKRRPAAGLADAVGGCHDWPAAGRSPEANAGRCVRPVWDCR